MTSSSLALPLAAPRAASRDHPLVERYAPVVTMVLALVVIWYVAAVAMNWSLVRDGFEREETPYTMRDVLAGTMSAERPLLPAPHQIVAAFLDSVFGYPPLAPRSLVYHSLVTLSATLLGFVLGALFGIVLALLIVHSRVLERSLLPWIICSQMVPIAGAGADLHRGARRARAARPAAEIDHLGLSVLLSDHHRHGEGLYLARSRCSSN